MADHLLGDPDLPAPPVILVRLDTLPVESWPGRRVWHPCCQMGDTPYWRQIDVPAPWTDPEATSAFDYDCGTVERVESHQPWPDLPPRAEARFLGLHYPGDNLWTEPDHG